MAINSSVVQSYNQIISQINEARAKAGSGPVALIAVTKTVDIPRIMEAINCGVTDIGENRVQEALDKYPFIGKKVRWHLIGHLQTNKAKKAAEIFDMVHSVDRLELAERLDRACADIGRNHLDILLQVNVDKDEAKFGMPPEAVPEVLEAVAEMPRIKVRGLMTIGRLTDDPEGARYGFRQLASLASHLRTLGIPGVEMTHLSMGMSGDFPIAIEEGSTMVRVGSAIFGSRK